MDQQKSVAIIGAGPAGLGAASVFTSQGIKVSMIDKEEKVGGHLAQWKSINPQMAVSQEVIDGFKSAIDWKDVSLYLQKKVKGVRKNGEDQLNIDVSESETLVADAVVYAGGFQLFDASRKEELGYGVYRNVITSVDLEKILKGEMNFPLSESEIQQVGIIHCVGSRDEKVRNNHCSRMCCMVGVKQAIEIKKRFPNSRVMNFYMDLRMFGRGYEELYTLAQREYGVQFIRGRVSEVAENIHGKLQLKAEDTLLGKPLKGHFDLLVLMVGMENADYPFREEILTSNADGFLTSPETSQKQPVSIRGVFTAGACHGPASVFESYHHGRSVALDVIRYLNQVYHNS